MRLKKIDALKKNMTKTPVSFKEDWDFDFSIYEEEEKRSVEHVKSIFKQNKPRVTNLKSKYSPSLLQLESLENIRTKISQYGILVASYSQDIQDLWNLYGALNEYWARIHDIYGSLIIRDVDKINSEARAMLFKAQKQDVISYSVHKKLLFLRDSIYMLAQRSNLGLEVERAGGTYHNKAKAGVIE